jgi:hypothetical protein
LQLSLLAFLCPHQRWRLPSAWLCTACEVGCSRVRKALVVLREPCLALAWIYAGLLMAPLESKRACPPFELLVQGLIHCIWVGR